VVAASEVSFKWRDLSMKNGYSMQLKMNALNDFYGVKKVTKNNVLKKLWLNT
jgi:hypothetical protein